MEGQDHSNIRIESDDNASSRKEDHIDLAFKSVVKTNQLDNRFYYEPILAAHPRATAIESVFFLEKQMNFPILVSSMTGGTKKAENINKNLAKICGEFGLGMGLGSCRQLLYESKRLHEFDVRQYMPNQPLMINLGIAQIEELIDKDELGRIEEFYQRLDADGLIIHVNPLQEWLQPEGDLIQRPAIESIEHLLAENKYPIIVKEVGQGFGKESLEKLLQLPLAAIDLAGFGGTNFSKLELLRSDQTRFDCLSNMFHIGHNCYEMSNIVNDYFDNYGDKIRCQKIIFSGGIKDFLDGYFFIKKSKIPSLYAQASGFLKYAQDYNQLQKYVQIQTEGFKMASAFLTIKN